MNKEMNEQMKKFIKNNIVVDHQEKTYFEQLSDKKDELMKKASKQVGKFKKTSTSSQEEADELFSYMTDYMNDLIEEGYSEEEAFEKAKVAFQVENPRNPLITNPRYNDWQQYYENQQPAVQEAIGLQYASGMMMGLASSTILGVGAQLLFNDHYYGVLMAIIIVCGTIFGLAFGMKNHAKIALKTAE